MAYVILGLTTMLARSRAEAGKIISQGGYEGLILDFPKDLGAAVEMLRCGGPLEDAEKAVGELLGSYSESWLYRNRHVLESLRFLPRSVVDVVCVGSLEQDIKIMDDRLSVALLEYRSMAGRVVPSRWREVLLRASRNLAESFASQSVNISKILPRRDRWLCIAGVHARKLADVLQSEGHFCRAILLGRPYLGTPLEALSAELVEAEPNDERVRYLVELHLEFIRDYVMESYDIDEAYDRWLENGQWARLYHQGLR